MSPGKWTKKSSSLPTFLFEVFLEAHDPLLLKKVDFFIKHKTVVPAMLSRT